MRRPYKGGGGRETPVRWGKAPPDRCGVSGGWFWRVISGRSSPCSIDRETSTAFGGCRCTARTPECTEIGVGKSGRALMIPPWG
jgi:hypothetical protein